MARGGEGIKAVLGDEARKMGWLDQWRWKDTDSLWDSYEYVCVPED